MEETIKQEYERLSIQFTCLEEEANFILNDAIQKLGIKINKIESRIKKLNSLIQKAERKEIIGSIQEIKDIVGIRIVCLFLSDINDIKEIVKRVFIVVEEDDKINGEILNEFGYMSLHYIVKMKEEYVGPRYDGIKDIEFEIQIRTMAMDSWANISHYLDYKTEKDIPDELKRDFYALSGLFYVADKHFEMFYKSRESKIEQLDKSIVQDKNYNQSINIDTLAAYLQTKMPDREHSGRSKLSEIVNELIESGYTNLDQLDEELNKSERAFLLYEVDNPPLSKPGRKFIDVGVVRISLEIVEIGRAHV